ncbi:hypothetical protein cypCar_00020622 [Cyprinus carpio]|nr:hypothetical protein cypCar_00020622 [Cyprinus carpio]
MTYCRLAKSTENPSLDSLLLRTDEMNGKVEGEDEEEEYLDEEEEGEDDEDEEEHPEEEEDDEKEDILDEKRKETEKQEQSITESDVQKKQIIKEESVPDGPKKEETQSEMNGVTEDKPKTLSGSRNRLSLFKRSSTKGNQAEMSTSGKPAADGPPQTSDTREPESSSSEAQIRGQTTASSRSRSATCNLL